MMWWEPLGEIGLLLAGVANAISMSCTFLKNSQIRHFGVIDCGGLS